jgi:hypothetical protein
MPNKIINFEDFIAPGFVSVWVGDFRSEDNFDDYLIDQFAAEFGFEVPAQAIREMGTEPQPVDLGHLVQGFSRSETFDLKVVAAARTRGVTMASSMFIIYNFKYDSSHQRVSIPCLKFIGAVPFPGFA